MRLLIFGSLSACCLNVILIQRPDVRFVSFVVGKHSVVGIVVLLVLKLHFDVSVKQFRDDSTVEVVSAVEFI